MKKLVLFASVLVAASFAACSDSKPAEPAADEAAAVEVVAEEVEAAADTLVAAADSVVEAAEEVVEAAAQ